MLLRPSRGSLLRRFEPDAVSDWDERWREDPYATFFHSPEWAKVWADYDSTMSLAPYRAEFGSGAVVTLAGLAQRNSARARSPRFVSSAAGSYGGWVGGGALAHDEAAELGEFVLSTFPDISWRLNPFDLRLSALASLATVDDHTQVIDLTAPFEVIRAGWTAGHRKAARRAVREGVTVSQALLGEDWQEYFTVYEASLRRWGDRASSRYGWPLFERLAAEGGEFVKLWVARYRGEIIAGDIFVYAKTHVAGWHGAALEEFFPLRPVNLLIATIMEDAHDRGFRWFDFNPSGGHAGPAAFKKSFGAECLAAPMVHASTSPAWTREYVRRLRGAARRFT